MMLRHVVILFVSGFCVRSELLNLDIGSECSWKGISGECANIYDCLSSYIDFQTKDFAPICSFQGREPIICCTDCKLNNTRNLVINPYLGILRKTGRKAQGKCLEYIHRLDYPCKQSQRAELTRFYNDTANCNDIDYLFAYSAFGGTDAYREEFPHMSLLGYGYDSETADWLCGGTVISERFILTAGHCLSSPSVGLVNFVALGILKRSDPFQLWQIYNVKRRIPHPEYKPPSKYHDIALLETDTEILFSSRVLPACLQSEEQDYEGLYATGWGTLGYRRELSDTLQSLYVYRFEEDECSKLYPPHRHLKNGYNHTTQMCYGDKEEPKDTCEGDSGGPLQYKDVCTYTVAGVTSYGRPCGVSVSSGIYTRVVYYVSWIETIVWP